MKVCVVAEFYPRAADPVLGVWAHRQALAARDAGADVKVLVLYRPVPPRAAARSHRALRVALTQPRRATLDGLEIQYVRFLAPPRPRSYGTWGGWAAPPLGLALRRLRRRFPFDLVHAHNAVPAGEAVRRAGAGTPLIVSVHGGDVFFTAPGSAAGADAVRHCLGAADIVLANSGGVRAEAVRLGARDARVLHLGADLAHPRKPPEPPEIATVGHLVARKRHSDVIRALWLLRDRHPTLRYVIVGDGPERVGLERLAAELDLSERVEFTGQLPHAVALERLRRATLLAMPSVDEAFGVAYVEAMAAGMPAIGSHGEPGPQEIVAQGKGLRLVAPGDVEALSAEIGGLLEDPVWLRELGGEARDTVAAHFTWERCGAATVAAYEEVLR